MIYSQSSLFNIIAAKVIEYADSKTKRELSMVDRRTRAVVLETVRSIRVFPAKYFPHPTHSSGIPQDILVRVICRYPTLERITFGPPKNFSGCYEFTSEEIPYLKSLISYLESAPEKHPLSSVKKIEFREIIESILDRFYERKIKELNNHFLSAISHKDLEKVAIRAYNVSSILTGAEIQPVLTNSPNLKTFEFDGFQSDQIVTISFASQPELTKVKLLQWRGEVSTIESLRQCAKLEELVIDYKRHLYRSNSPEEIKAILLNDHPWDLKRLVLKGISIENDEEFDALTKKLPNLERLEISLLNISDEGMELLGRNCPKLKYLKFTQKNLTNSALDGLTQNLPHLEIISFDEASKITNAGIASVGHNCKNLRFIQNGYFNKIEKKEIDALVKSFPRPKAPELNHDGPAAFTKAALCHIL